MLSASLCSAHCDNQRVGLRSCLAALRVQLRRRTRRSVQLVSAGRRIDVGNVKAESGRTRACRRCPHPATRAIAEVESNSGSGAKFNGERCRARCWRRRKIRRLRVAYHHLRRHPCERCECHDPHRVAPNALRQKNGRLSALAQPGKTQVATPARPNGAGPYAEIQWPDPGSYVRVRGAAAYWARLLG